MCLDYRALNKLIIKNCYSISRIEDLMDQFQGANGFSKVDLCSRFHQIKLEVKDWKKTAFQARYGFYELVVFYFWGHQCPNHVHEHYEQSLEKVLRIFCIVYMYDILIYSKTWKEHQRPLSFVLNKLLENKLYITPDQSSWIQKSVDLLGHNISLVWIKVMPDKIQIIQQWLASNTVKEVRAFVGLANCYSRFIHLLVSGSCH